MNKIRKGDEVVVITGKDKGRRGTVLQIFEDDRVLVEGVNVVKKHQKPNPNMGVQGGIVDREMPLDNLECDGFQPEVEERRTRRDSDKWTTDRKSGYSARVARRSISERTFDAS